MRVLVVGLVLVAFSGCTEKTESLVNEVEEPPVVTDPADYSYNTTRQHLHDYWDDQDTRTVFSKAQPIGAIRQDAHYDVVVRGDTDQVVPQGARWVNVTLSWSLAEPVAHGATELWLQTARESEPFLVGQVTSGEPVSFESDNGHNDLPHQRLSAWRFLLRFHADDAGSILVQGEVTTTVVAARGLEIPLYPGHPDPWRGADEIALLSFEGGPGVTAGPTDLGPVGGARWCLEDCLAQHAPDDGAIVPYDAAVVEVVVQETSGAGAASPGVAYHGADTLAWTRLEPDEDAGGERVYRIVVEEGAGDSAYARQSLWEFRLFVDEPETDGAFVGSYSLEVRTLRFA